MIDRECGNRPGLNINRKQSLIYSFIVFVSFPINRYHVKLTYLYILYSEAVVPNRYFVVLMTYWIY